MRWKINAVTVVNDNSSDQSKRGFGTSAAPRPTVTVRLWTFDKMNFARIAEDMGALGALEHAGAFPAALAQALAADRPAVIDVVTDIDALAPTAVA